MNKYNFLDTFLGCCVGVVIGGCMISFFRDGVLPFWSMAFGFVCSGIFSAVMAYERPEEE